MGQISGLAAKKDLEQIKRIARKGAEFANDYSAKVVELIKNAETNRPKDLAHISFFQFIQSSRGEALMSMLSVQGNCEAVCQTD